MKPFLINVREKLTSKGQRAKRNNSICRIKVREWRIRGKKGETREGEKHSCIVEYPISIIMVAGWYIKVGRGVMKCTDISSSSITPQ